MKTKAPERDTRFYLLAVEDTAVHCCLRVPANSISFHDAIHDFSTSFKQLQANPLPTLQLQWFCFELGALL